MRVFSALLSLLLASSVAAEPGEPTLLRSIATAQYKSAITEPDGSALVVQRDGVILRDAAGGTRFVARLKGNQRVVASAGGTAFGVVTYADNAPSTLHVIRFELYDRSGARRFRLDKPPASEFRISGDGRWIVGIAGGDGMREAELYLYNSAGEQQAHWTVPYLSHLTLPYSGVRFFAASRGELMSFSYGGLDPDRLGRFENFGISKDGQWVALSGAGTVFLLRGTALAFSAPTSVSQVRAIEVSPDGDYVAVAGGDRLEMFGREKRGLIWTVTSGEPDLRFISVDLSSGPCQVLCGLDRDPGPDAAASERHKGGAIYLFDEAGALVWSELLSYSNWSFHIPSVSFQSEDQQIEVQLAGEHRQYRLP